MTRSPGRARLRLVAAASSLAIALVLVLPAIAFAHPLGNFTINHFAALRVGRDRVDLDVVIDRAEIPAFQERQRLDTNGDGTLEPSETAGRPATECAALSGDLELTVSGSTRRGSAFRRAPVASRRCASCANTRPRWPRHSSRRRG
jgi:hypothetical protein